MTIKVLVGLRDNNDITYMNYGEDNTVIPIKIRRNLEFYSKSYLHCSLISPLLTHS